MIFAPALNGVLLIVSLACIPIVRHLAAGAPVWPYVLSGIVTPIACTVVVTGYILSMDLGVC
jgi:hypothetical protein